MKKIKRLCNSLNNQIYLYDGKEVKKISSNNYENGDPEIDNGKVTWCGYDGTEYQIFLYDGITTSKTRSDYTGSICYPKIKNGEIMWYSVIVLGYQPLFILHYYDGKTYNDIGCGSMLPAFIDGMALSWYDAPPILTRTRLWNGESFKTLSSYDGRVIWRAYDGRYYQVYSYDGSKTGEIKKLTSNTGSNTFDTLNVRVSNGQAVWSFTDGNSFQIYYSEGETPVKISNSSYNQLTPNINNGEIVWFGLDKVNDTITYNIYYKKDIESPITVIENFSEYYNYSYPKVENGQIVYVGLDGQIYLATPSNLTITNVGDGESIRLKWSKYEKDGKKIIYNIYRKLEIDSSGNPTTETDFEKINESFKLEYLDAPTDSKHPNIINSGDNNPKRGIIYDYKIEAIDSVSKEVLATYGGGEDTDGDGKYDVWKKGVTEPFIMLVAGFGEDDEEYWFKLKNNDLIPKRKFLATVEDQDYEINGITYTKPRTIWDYSLLENDLDSDPTNNLYDGLDKRIGQITPYDIGPRFMKQFKWWLQEMRDTSNRVDENGNLILDYTPEHFYIYCHSTGAPYSRELEKLINEHRARFDKELEEENLPYVAKNVMLSPMNLGSSLGSFLQSFEDGRVLNIIEKGSKKRKKWTATEFSKHQNVALFNISRKPSVNTQYYLLGGHNWYGGDFTDEGLLNTAKLLAYFGLYNYILSQEADSYIGDIESKNDDTLTVKLQRGRWTNKIWKKVAYEYGSLFSSEPFGLIPDFKNDYEFRPNKEVEQELQKIGEKHIYIRDTLPFNHYEGVVNHIDMQKLAWQQLDISPRDDSPISSLPENLNLPPSPPFPPFPPPYPYSVKYDAGILKTNEEQTFEITIHSNEDFYIGIGWDLTSTDFSISLESPEGQIFNGKLGGLPSNIQYYGGNTGAIYSILNANGGNWKIIVKGKTTINPDGDEFLLHYINPSHLQIDALFTGIRVPIGKIAPLGVKILEKETPVLNASITAKLTKESDQTSIILSLLDDGLQDNEIANDGIYGNKYTLTDEIEQMTVTYTANVVDSTGKSRTLITQSEFSIVQDPKINIYEIVGIRYTPETPPYENIEVDILVNFSFPNPYFITAKLYDSLDNLVANGYGEVRGEPGTTVTATIVFDGDEINYSGLDGPYFVKNFFMGKLNNSYFGANTELVGETPYFKASDFKFKDQDGDGISDLKEIGLDTDKTLVDTDNDGLTDYQEIYFDGDGEYTIGYDTDPLNPDTDGDGILDSLDDDPVGIPNNAPIADIKGEITYEATLKNGAKIFLDARGSCDLDKGDKIESYKWSGSFGSYEGIILDIILPLGEHDITLVVNDGDLDSKPLTVTIKVQDKTLPQLNVPEDLIVEATAILTPVNIGQATASDIFDVSVTNDAPEKFPLGQTIVTWVATDSSNNSVSGTQTINVQDTTPPEINVTITPNEIWPPNHKFVDIQANVTVSDIFATSIILSSITCNETATDFYQDADIGSTDYNFKLKAEREGNGQGRIYSIKYTVTDLSGNISINEINVKIHHDQGINE